MRIDKYKFDNLDNSSASITSSKMLNDGYNLLNIKIIKNLIVWKGFPYSFQALMLLVFISLIFIGWQVYTPENINDKLFAKTNIVTLVIWGIWWPLMVWFAGTMGRVWCMICPLELVSNITERLSQKLGVKHKPLSKWIRSGAIIVFLYALIQLLIAGIHIHRIPACFFFSCIIFIKRFSKKQLHIIRFTRFYTLPANQAIFI